MASADSRTVNSKYESTRDHQIREAAGNVIRTSLSAKPGDHILLVFDKFGHEVADGFVDAAVALSVPLLALYMPISVQDANCQLAEWRPFRALLGSSNAIITAVSARSDSTPFRVGLLELARENRLKIVHMPGVDEDVLLASILGVDLQSLYEKTIRVSKALTIARSAQIETLSSRSGHSHSLTLSLEGRTAHADGGLALPGEVINIPTGEAYIAPVEESAEGSIVINGSFPDTDLSGGREVVLVFAGGRLDLDACEFPNGGAGTHCRGLLTTAAEHGQAVQVGELGIGLNPAIEFAAGRTILDEKASGSAHIAIGANVVFGGRSNAPYHIDMVFYPESLKLDGKVLDAVSQAEESRHRTAASRQWQRGRS